MNFRKLMIYAILLVIAVFLSLSMGPEIIHLYKFRNDAEYRNKVKSTTWKNRVDEFYPDQSIVRFNEKIYFLSNAIFCDCLNQVIDCDYKNMNSDGSLGAYVELGEFSIEELNKEVMITRNFLDTLNLVSKHGNELNFMKCIKRLELFEQKR